MTPHQRKLLEAASRRLARGYAADIVEGLLHDDSEPTDADALFRTLVMDEKWHVEEAAELYYVADAVTGRSEGKVRDGD